MIEFRLRIGWAVLLFVFLTACSTVAAGVVPPPRPVAVELVPAGEPFAIIPTAYGFNTQNMNAEYSYADADFRRLTAELRPGNLRFPGGTVANFYHWQEAGFRPEELQVSKSEVLNKRLKGLYRRLQQKFSGKIPPEDFFTLCRATGARPLLVVNLYTGTPEESAAWVRRVKELGVTVAGWELGNELYLEHYRDRFPDPETYLKVARKHAAAMRREDPQILLAAPAAPLGFHLAHSGADDDFQERWNRGLAKGDFFDAVTVHFYTYAMVRQKAPVGAMVGHFFGSSERALDQGVDYYRALFRNRPVWLTEWNIANPKNPYLNTQLHALFVADLQLGLLQKSPQVPFSNYHVLAGRGQGWPAFSPPEKGESQQEKSVRRAVFPVQKIIGDALIGMAQLQSVQLSAAPSIRGSKDFAGLSLAGGRSLLLDGPDGHRLLLTNRSDQAWRLQSPAVWGWWKGTAKLRFVAATDWEATNGGNASLAPGAEAGVVEKTWSGPVTELVIPARSFGMIEFSGR
jgi:hypothetical protein